MPPSVKIAVFVGAIFLSLGIYLPFFPLWLEGKGFSTTQIAILLTVPLAVKVIFTPFVTALAGKMPKRRHAAVAYCLISLVSFLALGLMEGFWPILMLLALFGIFWHALIPLGDSFALSEVRLHGANYGTIRLWGSITFILANMSAGYLLIPLGIDGTFSLISLMLAISVVSALLLPHYGIPVDERPDMAPTLSGTLFAFFKNPTFMAVAASAALLQASHALIYGFGTIDWQLRGYTTGEIGLFWAIGVVAEILLFTQAHRLFSRTSPALLLVVGAIAAILRWCLLGWVEGFWLILAVQALHGLSFGATHLGTQSFIASKVGEESTPAAQGAIVFVSGVVMAALTAFSGVLYGQFGSHAFYAMALVSAFGLVPLFFVLSPKGSGGRV